MKRRKGKKNKKQPQKNPKPLYDWKGEYISLPVWRIFSTQTRHKEPSNKASLPRATVRASALPGFKTELDKYTSKVTWHGCPSQQAAGFGNPEVSSRSCVGGWKVYTQRGKGTGWKNNLEQPGYVLQNVLCAHVYVFSKTKFIQVANVMVKVFQQWCVLKIVQ